MHDHAPTLTDHPILFAADGLLEQCATFVRALHADPHAYIAPSAVLPGGSIGKHVRHCLDHFRAPLDAAETRDTIDYDRRARATPVESSPAHALAEIDHLRRRLAAIRPDALEADITVRLMVDPTGREALVRSTLARELAFATHHAVHHHAMIGAIAAERGLPAPQQFGKAPATVHHESRAADR